MLRAGYAAREPIGRDALAELGSSLYGPAGADSALQLLAPPNLAGRLRVERDGADFLLVIPMPAADREQTSLARVGDDLCLQVAGNRRSLSLPSGLRRCIVQGAQLRDGELRVRFRPDPALWRAP
jgi:arsenite-transporting ATPase